MFKFLKKMLICPHCNNKLLWNVLKENMDKIINADIKCSSCGKEYYVEEGIGNFLVDDIKDKDLWEKQENYLDKLFKGNLELKKQLMSAELEEMSAADMYIKSDILKELGQDKEANELYNFAFNRAYTEESIAATNQQIEYLINMLKEKEVEFIVDIASGSCTLVKEILSKTDLQVVATDFSMKIAKKTYREISKEGYENRISYLVFDSKKTPFKKGSIQVLTTYLGLQNIENPGNVLSELNRICSAFFYSICNLCSEEDETNRSALRKFGLESMYIKNIHKQELTSNGFNVEVLNTIYAKSSPTPTGKIIKGAGIDGFPVVDGIFEHCIIKGSV